MLPSETEFKQVGVLPGENVKMSFDENSLGFLADILINMYSDKEMAVIREYSTNASDSHKRAGVSRPIEVTTPSGLSFFFKVKDYGLGMSKEDIINIYSKYGASTKRIYQDENGMLGIGCKSALTYTDQFTIIAVKDGVKINVAVSRSVDGGGSMTILSETETSEPNGVEIVVPAQRGNNFARKCRQFFQYWEPDQVLINGEPPERADLQKITDRVYMRENTDYYDKPVVVMGGVAYEINQDQIRLPKSFVAFVEMGAVAFQPNREYLHYTPKTIATLESLKQEYKENFVKLVQSEIDDQSTRLAAVKTFNMWQAKLRYDDISLSLSDVNYKGEAFDVKFYFDYRWRHGDSFYSGAARRALDLTNLEGDVIVYNFDKDNLTPYQKRKLNYWADQNAKHLPRFFFVKDKPSKWLEDIDQLDWNTILELKIKREPRDPAAPKEKPQYDYYMGGRFYSTAEFDDTKPILYSTKTKWKQVTTDGYRIHESFPDVQFVFVGANRVKKFTKAFPTAKELIPGLKEMVQNFIDNLTDQDKVFLSSDKYELAKYSKLNKSRIDDPDIVALVDSSANTTAIAKLQSKWSALCGMGWDLGRPDMYDMFSQESQTTWVGERYPLFETLIERPPYRASESYWDHVYLYLNKVYEEYKNGV